jgi:hypothetical protein
MGKYEPLADYLREIKDDSWDASFAEIESILQTSLPASAREHRAWWANQYRGNHSQAKGWIDAGWETREIDQRRGRVRFERTRDGGRRDRTISDHELWKQAELISGVKDRSELERMVLTEFIQREAGRQLAALGGTMPNATTAPRRRVVW